eukprot:scaffold681_cov173-Ochromonas_danica.AAC.52
MTYKIVQLFLVWVGLVVVVDSFRHLPTPLTTTLKSRKIASVLHFDLGDQLSTFTSLDHDALQSQFSHAISHMPSWLLADDSPAAAAVSPYSKIDKTGFIGFIANYIEVAIDFGRVKVLTLPLTIQQLESTSRVQRLAPLQQQIQKKFAKDEETKNKLLTQLFQAAQVNPLAGCFPALVQIPVFISLYRSLTNLVAAHKLNEPFLWIPDLQGPVYAESPSKSMDWITSAFSGNPELGWHDTLAFLSLPLILFVSQSISTKLLTPPKDPNRAVSEQEQFSQNLINFLPLMVASFSINVPAGLSVYWIVNNILTTIITVSIRGTIQHEPFPAEVDQVMAFVDNGSTSKENSGVSPSMQEFKGMSMWEDRPKAEGFGSTKTSAAKEAVNNENESDNNEDDSEAGEGAKSLNEENVAVASDGKRRGKRSKPASKKGKRRE